MQHSRNPGNADTPGKWWRQTKQQPKKSLPFPTGGVHALSTDHASGEWAVESGEKQAPNSLGDAILASLDNISGKLGKLSGYIDEEEQAAGLRFPISQWRDNSPPAAA